MNITAKSKLDLSKLNSRQREAVLHGDGPLLVLAGAGSGKTSTMAYRIAHLIAERKTLARAILGLSFTNKAAGELKERVSKLVAQSVGPRATVDLTISTFHSLCVRILRTYGHKLGFQKDFSILDESDQKDVLKQVFKNIRIDDRRFDLDLILFQIGQAKSRFMKPQQAEAYFLDSARMKDDYAVAAASSYTKYQEQLQILNSMDFDDLLFNGIRLLEEHADVRAHYNERFKYVLVDEYQDTNPAQFRLLSLLTERQQNLCVVGDDDQSIYAWRGADPTHILGFARHFSNAHTVILDQNYRSTNTILNAANHVITNNRVRHPKKLWSERGEGEPIQEVILEDDREESKYVAEEIFRIAKERTRPWKDFAILYRSNAQSRVFEEALRALRVPYKIVGGYSFLDRKEVKNVLAYWKIVTNPHDDASLRRILNWPARGIGKASVDALGTFAFENSKSLFDAMAEAPKLTPRAATPATVFRQVIENLRSSLNSIPAGPDALAMTLDWARRSLENLQIKKAVEEDSEDDPVLAGRKWENVEELVHALGQVRLEELRKEAVEAPVSESPALLILREFLSRMMLDAKETEDKDDPAEKDEVTLLTLHGAKGLEYPVVFLVGMEEGFLPHKRTLEEASDLGEERRLCYVGITRARDHLIVTRAKNRVRYGKPVPRYRSRFLEEIKQDLLIISDESLGPPVPGAVRDEEHEKKVKDYLAEIKAKLMKQQ